MKRKISLVLVILIMITLLYGCGNKTEKYKHLLSEEEIKANFPYDFKDGEDVYKELENIWTQSYDEGFGYYSDELEYSRRKLEDLSNTKGNDIYRDDGISIEKLKEIYQQLGPFIDNLIRDVRFFEDQGVPIENATKVGDFYFVFYKTEARKFAIVFYELGAAVALVNLNKSSLSKEDFGKLNGGMDIEEVKKIDPSTIIFNEDKDNNIYSYHFFDDWSCTTIYYIHKNGKLVIDEIFIGTEISMFFEGPYLIYHTRNG